MPRWFTLTSDHLKAAGHGLIIDKAASLAIGSIDPVQEAISNATARVQRAIASGNVLDADPTKIPASFKGVAEKLALFDLMERIGLGRSPSQEKTFDAVQSDLKRAFDEKLKVEEPDTLPSAPQIQATGIKAEAINVPRRQTGRWRTSGL